MVTEFPSDGILKILSEIPGSSESSEVQTGYPVIKMIIKILMNNRRQTYWQFKK